MRCAAVLVVALGACTSHPPNPPPGGDQTAMVVGVQTEPLNGAVGSVHVTTTLAAQPNSDETMAIGDLPHEVKLVPPGGDTSAPIAVAVEGHLGDAQTPVMLGRTAETSFVPGQCMLLRIKLQGQCVLSLPGGPPGGPSCSSPQTCINGRCADDHVPATALEPCAPDWATNEPDICKPANAGPPKVYIGTGQTDYLPLTDGQTLQMELGPQGGHHIWIATRMQNLKQSGSTTRITSAQPGGVAGPTTAFVFTFDQDEGGFCKLAGLRYQLDTSGDYHTYLGKPLDVTVTIKDQAGATGSATAHINIDSAIKCPNGTSSDAGC